MRPIVGRRPRRRRSARAVSSERTVGDLPALRRRATRSGPRLQMFLHARASGGDARSAASRRAARRATTGSALTYSDAGSGLRREAAGEPYVVRLEGARPRRLRRRRPASREDRVRVADRRHASADEIGRLADVPSRQRRRRSSDGDLARFSRRGMGFERAQASAALLLFRLGAAQAFAPAVAPQSGQEQAQQTQESHRHPLLSGDGVSARGAR